MPRSTRSRRIILGFSRPEKRIPIHLLKKVTSKSPQLILPSPGHTIEVEVENGVKFRMTVLSRATWVPDSKSGSYQVKVSWVQAECIAYWNKAARKWALLIPPSSKGLWISECGSYFVRY